MVRVRIVVSSRFRVSFSAM